MLEFTPKGEYVLVNHFGQTMQTTKHHLKVAVNKAITSERVTISFFDTTLTIGSNEFLDSITSQFSRIFHEDIEKAFNGLLREVTTLAPINGRIHIIFQDTLPDEEEILAPHATLTSPLAIPMEALPKIKKNLKNTERYKAIILWDVLNTAPYMRVDSEEVLSMFHHWNEYKDAGVTLNITRRPSNLETTNQGDWTIQHGTIGEKHYYKLSAWVPPDEAVELEFMSQKELPPDLIAPSAVIFGKTYPTYLALKGVEL